MEVTVNSIEHKTRVFCKIEVQEFHLRISKEDHTFLLSLELAPPPLFDNREKKDSGKREVAITAVLAKRGWDSETFSNNSVVISLFILIP